MKRPNEISDANLKERAVKGAGINFIAQSSALMIQTIGVIVMSRLLMPEDFGLVAMVTVFSLWIMGFGVNGFTEYIVQNANIRQEQISDIFWLNLTIAVFSTFLFIGFGLVLVKFYSEPVLFRIASVVSTSFIMQALSMCHYAILQKEMKFASIAITEFIAVVLSFLIGVAAALLGMGYWAVVFRQLTISLVPSVAGWYICDFRPGPPRHSLKIKTAFKFAIKVYSNFSLSHLTKHIDRILLGKFHGTTILGNYDRALHFSLLPAGQLLMPLHSVALSTLSKLKTDELSYVSYYIKAVSVISLIGAFITVLMYILAQDFIFFLLGPEWSEAGMIVRILGMSIAGTIVYGTVPWLHLSLGTPGRWLKWNIFSSIVTIFVVVLVVPYGVINLAIAYVTKTYLIMVPGIIYAGKPMKINFKMLIVNIGPYFLSAFATCIVWKYFLAQKIVYFNFLQYGIFVKLLSSSFFLLILYFGIIVILDRGFKSIDELSKLIKIVLKRPDF